MKAYRTGNLCNVIIISLINFILKNIFQYYGTIELNLNKNYFLQSFHSMSITVQTTADVTV